MKEASLHLAFKIEFLRREKGWLEISCTFFKLQAGVRITQVKKEGIIECPTFRGHQCIEKRNDSIYYNNVESNELTEGFRNNLECTIATHCPNQC